MRKATLKKKRQKKFKNPNFEREVSGVKSLIDSSKSQVLSSKSKASISKIIIFCYNVMTFGYLKKTRLDPLTSGLSNNKLTSKRERC